MTMSTKNLTRALGGCIRDMNANTVGYGSVLDFKVG